MADDERPQKMRKLSHDHDASQVEVDAAKNKSNVTGSSENAGSGAPLATEATAVIQNDAVAETFPPESEAALRAESGAGSNGQDAQPMSKNQLKKLRKKQEWEAGREERKIIRKEKVVAKRERKRAAKQEGEDGGEQPLTGQAKSARHILRPVQLPVTIVLDCDFDNLMRDHERVSLASQITRCYSDNKNSKFRAHLTISSFGGHLRERFEVLLKSVHLQWKGMRFMDEDFVETAEKAKEWMTDTRGKPFKGAFAKYADLEPAQIEELKQQGEVVYLSSESDDTLEELKPFSTYIVGGLVDKNREKGICHKRAVQRGVRTAKLPIGKYLDMASRKVLATNHVNEIMVQWLESGDWGEAFMKVMPKRKGGKLLTDEDGKDDGGEDPADAEEDDAEAGADDEKALQEQVDDASMIKAGEETSQVAAAASS